jgi:SAM-dependent methyltransferase
MESAFREAYRANAWGDPESVSGPGSGIARTAAFRDEIPPLLRDLHATSMLDVGCGDFNWMRLVDLPVERYLGIDIVPELVEQNRRHADRKHAFMLADFTRAELPRTDVILCRDCLVHFAFADVWAALANFARSGSRWLLTTTFVDPGRVNADIATGDWRPLNLQLPPFNFPAPERMIDERCLHTGGIYVDKRLALWRLEGLDRSAQSE